MALLRQTNWWKIVRGNINSSSVLNKDEICKRWYYSDVKNKSKEDWKKLRPMIKERIENRASMYPLKAMIPVAEQVLEARSQLIHGVSTLLNALPVFACKFCPEVHAGEAGHQIQTCWGYKRLTKNQVHRWIKATLNDILVPVETFHLDGRIQDVIKHDERFDFERVPAVVELCRQAGANPHKFDLQSSNGNSDSIIECAFDGATSLSKDGLKDIGTRTLNAWETLREGVEKLMLVYSVKVCKHCSEVHVGPSGHKARHCGVFKYQNFRGNHFWEKAVVDDLIPPKVVWHQRPQDPPVLLHEGRNYYGHAPVVVDLCSKAGAIPPVKYMCMMKAQGLAGPPPGEVSG